MILSVSNIDSHIFYLTSAMLFRPYDGVSYPEVCEDFTVSEDKTVYTYKLRDAQYSDGTPITAEHLHTICLHVSTPKCSDGSRFDQHLWVLNAAAYNAGECSREDVN